MQHTAATTLPAAVVDTRQYNHHSLWHIIVFFICNYFCFKLIMIINIVK